MTKKEVSRKFVRRIEEMFEKIEIFLENVDFLGQKLLGSCSASGIQEPR